MEFQVDCECGERIPVSAGMAGASVQCACGRTVAVPSLAGLRREAGLPAYDASPEMLIPYLVSCGQLPPAEGCLGCGNAEAAFVNAVAECERTWMAGRSRGGYAAAWLLGGWLGMLLYRTTAANLHGRDLDVPVPFKACPRCRRRLTGPLPPGFRWLKFVLAAAGLLTLPVSLVGGAMLLAAAPLAWGADNFVKRRAQESVKNLLQSVAVYSRLLEKYPEARIVWRLPHG